MAVRRGHCVRAVRSDAALGFSTVDGCNGSITGKDEPPLTGLPLGARVPQSSPRGERLLTLRASRL